MKRFIAAGGGNEAQSKIVDEFFLQFLPRKKFLYLPQAAAPEYWSFAEAFDWIKSHKIFHECEIVMWENIANKSQKDLNDFDAIFVMGGNTFTLLQRFTEANFPNLLTDFITSGRPVYGFSAGSILMGKSIEVAEIGPPGQADSNTIGLTNFEGLNWAGGYTLYTHYRLEEDQQLFEYSKRTGETIIGIPEDSAIYGEDNVLKVIGAKSIAIIHQDKKFQYEPGEIIPPL